MKLILVLPVFLVLSIAISGCYESKPAPKYPVEGAVDLNQPVSTGVNASVKHYICSNNCVGSGGDAAGTCPVCGNAYTHNDAYHNQATTTPTTSPAAGATTESTTTNVTFTDPNSTEPAQNAAGVWHYTCGNGCEGGAGAAGNCAKCGAALAHNSEYHN